MTTTTDNGTDSRFWLMLLDEIDDGHWAGWWGVVDEQAGGIIATAATIDTATVILRHFEQRAAGS